MTAIKFDLQCSMRIFTNVKGHISIQVLIKRHELEICYRWTEASLARSALPCQNHTLLLLQIQVPRKYYWFVIRVISITNKRRYFQDIPLFKHSVFVKIEICENPLKHRSVNSKQLSIIILKKSHIYISLDLILSITMSTTWFYFNLWV